ncbi:MAG TPA: CinA family protein [Micromonosporaceae bacterium]|nr:CinA family protein [Micromonosporaceae bacterium]
MASRAAEIVSSLRARGQTLAVAESLTGGRLCAAVVDVPGASTVFRGGLVVYATDLKTSLAGVPDGLLAARGAVDPQVAAALAAGARRRCGADWGLGTTGVAGPDPQDGKPVGTVFVACHGPVREVVRPLRLAGDRSAIRSAAVTAALDLLREELAQATGADDG